MKIRLQKSVLFLLVISMNSSGVFCQEEDMGNKVEEIKVLGRDSIVEIAYAVLEDSYSALKIRYSIYKSLLFLLT